MKIAETPSFAARRLSSWALAFAVLLSMLSAAAVASERVALVVGNAEYEHVRDLANPQKDADDIGAALGRLGFEVTHLENVGYRDLLRGLQKFEAAAARAEIAVVFYAGHGIEVDKHNYLVPVEARLATDSDVKYEAVPLDVVMAAAEVASTLGLVILDACRDNPFLAMMRSTGLARSVDRGLARVEPRGTGKSMLVAYSAKEGTTAADGEPGGNSPYAAALLKHLERPELHVGDLFIEVRKEMLATPGSQTPVEYGALVEKIFLASRAAPPADAAKAAEIVLPGGLTLADWALLAEDRLKSGDHARLLEEAAAHLREHGPVRSVEAVRERALSGLIKDVRVAAAEDAPGALDRIARLEAEAGPLPELLRLSARAHGLLGDHAAEEAAHLEWLRSVPQSHPDRRDVLAALAVARAAREASRRFSERLGRPFSPERREASVGWTDLHYAAALDLPGAVDALCDAGMAPDARLKTGSPPFGDDLVRILASLGHDFEDWTADRETPLIIASIANARDAAAALLDCGADVMTTNDYGETPLHWAARENALEAAELLIDRGADMMATDHSGETPLHFASYRNAPETAGLLIDRGTDVHATDEDGNTPLHHAAYGDAPEAAELLIKRGTDMEATNASGETPLHWAARENALEAAELLIKRGADMEATNDTGDTPLHLAALNDSVESAELLIDRGANMEAAGASGWTPLHWAAVANSVEAAKLLIDRAVDVNVMDDNGFTPLHSAAWNNALEATGLLIDRGADLHATADNGFTPLHHAAYGDAPEAAELLIDRGADVNATDNSGATPLHRAAWENSPEAAELLIDRGADLHATADNGFTPLHHAAYGDALEAVNLLIDRGADVSATADNGVTPLDLALHEGHREVQAVLRSRGENTASAEETEKGLALNGEERRLIQVGLASLGHDPGPADGVFGRRTRAALRAWQGSTGLDATGHLTREQFEGLMGLGREREARGAAAARQFSELLGRPFSPDRREASIGWTDLHYAAVLDLPGAVAALCDAGMSPDARLKTGPPFGDDLLRILAMLGYDFNDWTADRQTPLIIASIVNARDAVAALIDCGADMEATVSNGYTPLHFVAYNDAVEAARLLIDRGADLNAKDDDGWTPLHFTAYNDAVEAARLLIDRGADVNAKDDDGWTPLDLALRKGNDELPTVLRSHGGRCATQC